MQIRRVSIQNFRAISHLEIMFLPLTKLVGANNVGKSTVLSAIELFFDAAPKVSELDHHQRNVELPISITIDFDQLTPSEQEEFGHAVIGSRLCITRELSALNSEASGYIVVANTNPDFVEIWMEAGAKKLSAYREVASRYNGELPAVRSAAEVDQALTHWQITNPQRLSLQRIRGLFGATNVANGKLKHKTTIRLVPAVKEVATEVRDGKKSPIIGLLSDLARQSLENREDLRRALSEARGLIGDLVDPSNYPQLSNISTSLTEALERYYSGCRIAADWAAVDPISFNNPIPRIQVESSGILTPVENVGHGLQRAVLFSIIEYLASQALNSLAGERRFEEAASDIILLIEEPEIYQHPSKQTTIAEAFSRLVKSFNSQSGIRIQIILTTHSEKFVNISNFENVRILRKVATEHGQAVSCRMCTISDVSKSLSEKLIPSRSPMSDAQFLPKLHTFNREVSEGFFADKVVLVEGVSDRAAVYGAFAMQGRSPDTEGIAIIPVDGKTKIDKPWVVFRMLGIPTYVIFDNDISSTSGRTEYNRFLQNIAGVEDIVDFPVGVFPHFCAIDGNLEACIKRELGAQSDAIYSKAVEVFGVEPGDVCKVPAVVTSVFAMAKEGGLEFSVFRDIVAAIDAL